LSKTTQRALVRTSRTRADARIALSSISAFVLMIWAAASDDRAHYSYARAAIFATMHALRIREPPLHFRRSIDM